MTKPPAITLDEYAARRNKVLAALKKSVGVIVAGDDDAHGEGAYRPHPHFEYLTGVTDEPGAVLLLDPANPVPARRQVLFLRPLDPEEEKWDGYRLEIGAKLRETVGIKAVFRLGHLPRVLTAAATRSKSLACLHPLAAYDQPVSPDLDLFNKIAERVPGVSIEDQTEVLAKLRAVKSRDEVKMIQHSIDITRIGFETVLRAITPGMNEFDVQETLEHAYKVNGARGMAFDTIAGSGVNTTVLHYEANDQTIDDGDLVLIDSGAAVGGYRADITRTVPANGSFTKRQREIYELVLKAEEAAIKACRPGRTLAQIDQVARKIITDAGYGDAFIHSIGHHLGLETHDITPDEPLRAGAVITIEPGIYLPEEKIGVRIEDDILITSKGCRNLSKEIPKSVSAIEKLMRAR
jgi:Xaa-Pro aminopeptidase